MRQFFFLRNVSTAYFSKLATYIDTYIDKQQMTGLIRSVYAAEACLIYVMNHKAYRIAGLFHPASGMKIKCTKLEYSSKCGCDVMIRIKLK